MTVILVFPNAQFACLHQGSVTPTGGPLTGSLHCSVGSAYLRKGVTHGLVMVRCTSKHLSGPCGGWALCSHPEPSGGTQSPRTPERGLFGWTDPPLLGRFRESLGMWFRVPLQRLRPDFFFKPFTLKSREAIETYQPGKLGILNQINFRMKGAQLANSF